MSEFIRLLHVQRILRHSHLKKAEREREKLPGRLTRSNKKKRTMERSLEPGRGKGKSDPLWPPHYRQVVQRFFPEAAAGWLPGTSAFCDGGNSPFQTALK